MKLTVFSLAEANRAVIELRPRLERLVRARKDYDRRTQLGHEISEGIRGIQERGCLVKDLDIGLLDFYAISGDRLIFLCWRLGEREITHWHPLEGGFAGRQPLDASDL